MLLVTGGGPTLAAGRMLRRTWRQRVSVILKNELAFSSTEGSTWSPTEEAAFSGAESVGWIHKRQVVQDGR